MCGIAGWIGAGQAPGTLEAMTARVAHRGPDGDGHVEIPLGHGRIAALGHRRLSIIDIATGGQPMQSHDGRFEIVYNGEIYNYLELREQLREQGARFVSNSDTEVIIEAVRAWGIEALRKFRGMFAFALCDREQGEVILARDPFGKKPLFLHEAATADGPQIVFGSEIQALLAHPSVRAELDTDSLFDQIMWRYVPGPATFFKGIRKLGPGSYLTIKGGTVTETRYWDAPERAGHETIQRDDAIEAFLEIFDEAVKLRLRADVPVGAFLSGGLDSASIVATLAHLGVSDIRTFSVGFRDDPASELAYAAETAAAVGTIHTPVVLDPDTMAEHLPMLTRHRGAPVAEPADLPIYMMSVVAQKDVKVILSGEGSDEMFAGYPKHLIEKHLGRFAPSGLLSAAGHAALAATSLAPNRFRRLRIAAKAMSRRKFEDRMVGWFGAFSTAERDRLWRGPASHRGLPDYPFHAAAGGHAPAARSAFRPDIVAARQPSGTNGHDDDGRLDRGAHAVHGRAFGRIRGNPAGGMADQGQCHETDRA